MSSIAPDELADLIRAALVPIRKEDRDPVCVRDALWLAATINAADQSQPSTHTRRGRRRPDLLSSAEAQDGVGEDTAQLAGHTQPGAAELFDDQSESSAGWTQGIPARRVTLGGPGSLRDKLELARAIRPFRQFVPSRYRMTLDVEATVRATAAARKILPILRPSAERRFSADLILDTSPSMLPWEGAFAELVGLFAHVGAFRSVRAWQLHVDGDDVSLADWFARRRAPGALRATDRRRVVIIVTDAVAEHWYRPVIWRHISNWGSRGTIALIDLLPVKLWSFSGIGPHRVRVHAKAAAAANAELSYNIPRRWRLDGRWTSPSSAIPVPVVELSSTALAQWSAMIATAYPAGSAAVLVESGMPGRPALRPPRNPDGQASLTNFLRTASPEALRLAVLAATVDSTTLAVLRAIQQEMLPDSAVSDLAEVLVSGIFQQIPDSHRSDLRVRMNPECRAGLRALASPQDRWDVYRAISAAIRRASPESAGSFQAAVYDPTGDSVVPEGQQAFAEIARSAWIQAAGTLADLAPDLPSNVRSQTLTDAFAAVVAIGDERSRAQALIDLAPHLPPDLLQSALAAASAISDNRIRAQALTDLAPHLPTDLQFQAEALVTQRTEPAGWDFFISYAQADRMWAEWIAWVLEEQSYRVLVQAWDSVPGNNWIKSMHAGTRDAAYTIAVLSDAYLASPFGNAEWQAAWAADPPGRERTLLTIRVMDCDRPALLVGVVGIDLFGLSEAAARVRLLDVVSATVADRARPSVPPGSAGAGRAVPSEPWFPGTEPRLAPHPEFSTVGSIMLIPSPQDEPESAIRDPLVVRMSLFGNPVAENESVQIENSTSPGLGPVFAPLSTAELEDRMQLLYAEAEAIGRVGAEPSSSETGPQPGQIIVRLRQIITDMVQLGKPSHPLALRVRDLYAYWLGRASLYQEALHQYDRLVKAREMLYGPEHGDVLATRHNLAHMIGLTGEAAEAVSRFKRIVEDRKRLLGNRHRDTLLSMGGLAYWTALSGDVLKSVELYKELYADDDWLLGPLDEETLTSLSLLAWALSLADDPTGARDCYADLAERWTELNGPESPEAVKYAKFRAYWAAKVDDPT